MQLFAHHLAELVKSQEARAVLCGEGGNRAHGVGEEDNEGGKAKARERGLTEREERPRRAASVPQCDASGRVRDEPSTSLNRLKKEVDLERPFSYLDERVGREPLVSLSQHSTLIRLSLDSSAQGSASG